MAAFRSRGGARVDHPLGAQRIDLGRSPVGTASLVNTTQRSPARAAYAAPALPEDAATTVSAPAATAAATPTAIARSLCEPVGLPPSYFSHTSPAGPPSRSGASRSRMSGV